MLILSLVLGVLLIAADQIIKALVNSNIPLHKVIEVIKFGSFKVFSLTQIRNQGAAWSMMEGKKWFLIGLPVLVCCAGVGYMIWLSRKGKARRIDLISLTLLISGGIGNLIDRIRLGEVIDYILFEPVDFPIFNFADICVVIGAFLFCIAMLTEDKAKKFKAQTEETSGDGEA